MTTADQEIAAAAAKLFAPCKIGNLSLKTRIVMPPMTRCFSPGGVPGDDVAAYYRRRAENDVGLLITEGAWIPHPGAANEDNAPRFYGADALAGWKKVVDEVHAAGGKIMPQLWHVGLQVRPQIEGLYADDGALDPAQVGPSGMVGGIGRPLTKLARDMTQADIDSVIDAYATSAHSAWQLGFDGIALHGAHGYIIDQFLWDKTNLRGDRYGGSIAARSQFGAEVVAEIRRRTSPDFPIMMRLSQWKAHDYSAQLAETPQELEALLAPFVDAGVDIFDCSQRRFWETEFGSDMNLAGWTRKLSGKPSMTVGSVSLNQELFATLFGATAEPASIDRLIEMFDRGDFDLVAVGRALIANPDWVSIVRDGRFSALKSYAPSMLETLH